MNVRYFEDYDEREFITQGRTLGEADIINFAGLTGDWAQMHTNAEYASKGVFGQRVGHGHDTLTQFDPVPGQSGLARVGLAGPDGLAVSAHYATTWISDLRADMFKM